MKLQDTAFLVIIFILVFARNPKWLVWAGIICLILSIPLFATWTFFTAERLTWYAAAFFLTSVVFYILQRKRKQV